MYKVFIHDKIVKRKLKEKYGSKYKFEPLMQYQYQWGNTKIDITFTKDLALWICKYKNKYYMNIIEEVEYKDDFTAIDIYTTLAENAVETIKALKRTYDDGEKKSDKKK